MQAIFFNLPGILFFFRCRSFASPISPTGLPEAVPRPETSIVRSYRRISDAGGYWQGFFNHVAGGHKSFVSAFPDAGIFHSGQGGGNIHYLYFFAYAWIVHFQNIDSLFRMRSLIFHIRRFHIFPVFPHCQNEKPGWFFLPGPESGRFQTGS